MARASQSKAPPGPLVSVTVSEAPGATVGALTVRVGGLGLATVTGGLVAAKVKPLFKKSRNSYCAGVVGMVTVQVRVVTPAPT